MKYLSLFSGIGGFELGIQQAYESNNEYASVGSESEQEKCTQGRERSTNQHGVLLHYRDGAAPLCIGFSEIDKYACQIYDKQFNHTNYGDITTIEPKELPDFDLLVGGFPCQAFSIAGKRKGFDDTRGTLFFDIARICAEKRPRYLVLENVKGLLSHDGGKTFQTILGVLADLGYAVEWQVLNSKNFGVPQNRERVFIIGYLGGFPRRKVFPITGDSQPTATVAGYISEKDWPRRHEQIRRVYNTDGAMPTIPTGQGGGVMTKIVKNYKTDDEIAVTLSASSHKGYGNDGVTMVGKTRIRRLTPKECERLQGFPDDWTQYGVNEKGEEVAISDTQRYKVLGNAVSCPVITAIVKRMIM